MGCGGERESYYEHEPESALFDLDDCHGCFGREKKESGIRRISG